MKLVTTKFKSGGLYEKHVVATWNLGNHLSICLLTQGNQEKPVSRWPVAGPIVSFSVESIALLHQYFPQYVCSAQYGCFL